MNTSLCKHFVSRTNYYSKSVGSMCIIVNLLLQKIPIFARTNFVRNISPREKLTIYVKKEIYKNNAIQFFFKEYFSFQWGQNLKLKVRYRNYKFKYLPFFLSCVYNIIFARNIIHYFTGSLFQDEHSKILEKNSTLLIFNISISSFKSSDHIIRSI